ncbi:MAG TPA: transglycosylase SLT domain-containing protein [Candidatus Competibacteraceae bacterium]|nr:transglycosylase SLT domain-containing protein [Candidatus Competibacteraceae bacterium]
MKSQSAAVLLAALLLGACASPQPPVGQDREPQRIAARSGTTQGSVWQRLRRQLRLADQEHPRIQEERTELSRKPRYIQQVSARAQPFLHYILSEMDSRDLPAELAVIPMIESGYRPDAVSPGQAAGLWQIQPGTARVLGLRMDRWYDGRKSVPEATDAALDYLERLHEQFDGDWLLALAAYNAGAGTVQKAIERNRRAGKPTDFWNLSLPAHTREYVPRIIALSQIIAAPDSYGVKLTELANVPYLVPVDIGPGVNLSAAAEIAGISAEQLLAYNPALKSGVTPPQEPAQLLLPKPSAEQLQARAAELSRQSAVASLPADHAIAPAAGDDQRRYTVRRGDTLGAIAERHGVSSQELADWNGLRRGTPLRPGQQLVILVQPPRSG